MKKKIICISLVMMFVISTVVFSAELSFKDTQDHWAKESIYAMAEKWVILGYGDGTFRPDENITKTHAFLMFSRIMGYNDTKNEVVVDNAIKHYEQQLKDNEITQGLGEVAYLIETNVISFEDITKILGNGKENENLTRQEAAYVFVKLLNDENQLNKFPLVLFEDKENIDEEYLSYVEYANKMGLMIGIDDTHFDPTGSVTRAQIATILYRIDKIVYERTAESVSGIVKSIDIVNNTIEIEKDNEIIIYNLSKIFETYNDTVKVSRTTIKPNDYVTLYLEDGDVEKVIIKNVEIIVYGEYISYVKNSDGTLTITTKIEDNNVDYTLFSNCQIVKNNKNLQIANIEENEKIELQILNGKIQKIVVGAFSQNKSGVITEIVIGAKSYLTIKELNGNTNKYEIAQDVQYDFDGATGNIYDLRLNAEVRLTVTHNGITKVKVETLTNIQIINGTVEQILPKIYVFTMKLENDEVMMMFLDEKETIIKTGNGALRSIEDISKGNKVSVFGRFEEDVFYPIQVIVY